MKFYLRFVLLILLINISNINAFNTNKKYQYEYGKNSISIEINHYKKTLRISYKSDNQPDLELWKQRCQLTDGWQVSHWGSSATEFSITYNQTCLEEFMADALLRKNDIVLSTNSIQNWSKLSSVPPGIFILAAPHIFSFLSTYYTAFLKLASEKNFDTEFNRIVFILKSLKERNELVEPFELSNWFISRSAKELGFSNSFISWFRNQVIKKLFKGVSRKLQMRCEKPINNHALIITHPDIYFDPSGFAQKEINSLIQRFQSKNLTIKELQQFYALNGQASYVLDNKYSEKLYSREGEHCFEIKAVDITMVGNYFLQCQGNSMVSTIESFYYNSPYNILNIHLPTNALTIETDLEHELLKSYIAKNGWKDIFQKLKGFWAKKKIYPTGQKTNFSKIDLEVYVDLKKKFSILDKDRTKKRKRVNIYFWEDLKHPIFN